MFTDADEDTDEDTDASVDEEVVVAPVAAI